MEKTYNEKVNEYVEAMIDSITKDNIHEYLRLRIFDSDDDRCKARIKADGVRRTINGGFTVFPTLNIPSYDGEETYSATIPYTIVKRWYSDTKELFEDAIKCMGSPVLVSPVDMRNFLDVETADAPDMMVLMFEKENGASVLAVDGIAEKVGEIVGGSYWIIPMSIHDLMVVRDDGKFTSYGMNQILSEGNKVTINENEFLSDRVRYYDKDTNKVHAV